MGRSSGGLTEAQSHIKMNKLLLALAIGLGLLALVAGSSEEENQVDSFESGLDREARDADPSRRQSKNQAKGRTRHRGRTRQRRKNRPRGRTRREGLTRGRG